MSRRGIWKTAVSAWGRTFRSIRHMPMLYLSAAIMAFALILVGHRAGILGTSTTTHPGAVAASRAAWFGASLVLLAAQSAVEAQVAVRVHRFVLLGEISDAPAWIAVPHFGRFFVWLLGLQLVWRFEGLLESAVQRVLPIAGGFVVLLGTIVVIVVTARTILIFPAIAIGEKTASLEGSWHTSRGHFWFIFGSGAAGMLPLVGIFIVIGLMVLPMHGGQLVLPASSLVFWAVIGVMGVLTAGLYAALASLIFRRLNPLPDVSLA